MRPTQSQLVGRVKEKADGFHMNWDDFLEETKGRILHLLCFWSLLSTCFKGITPVARRYTGVGMILCHLFFDVTEIYLEHGS